MLGAIFNLGYYRYEMMKHKRTFPLHPEQGDGSLPDPRVKPTSNSDKPDTDTGEE